MDILCSLCVGPASVLMHRVGSSAAGSDLESQFRQRASVFLSCWSGCSVACLVGWSRVSLAASWWLVKIPGPAYKDFVFTPSLVLQPLPLFTRRHAATVPDAGQCS